MKEAGINGQTGSLIDPRILMTIKNLELRARVVVEGFWNGLHRSPYHGFSVEFSEYRPYAPGDDPRYLDWRLYARSDRYYLKKFEDETNLRCHLLVDNSRSMHFGSLGFSKADYAGTLAASLAWFLHRQGDAVGLLVFDEQVRDYLPARHRPGHLRHLMLALEKPASGSSTDLAVPLQRIAEMVKKRGFLVFISDLLAPIESLKKHLAGLRAFGHEMLLFHLLDPAEINLDFESAAFYRDIETGREVYVDPTLARKGYQRRLEAHLTAARAACQDLGIDYVHLATNNPLELALFEYLSARMRRKPQLKRRGRWAS